MKIAPSNMLCLFIVAISNLMAVDTYATPEFAQKFRSKCRSCHTKNNTAGLNQTGVDFKASLDSERANKTKKVEADKTASSDAPSPTSPAAVEEKTPSAAEEMATGSGEDLQNTNSAVEQREPATYQWIADDGTMFFTDNAGLRIKHRQRIKKEHSAVKIPKHASKAARISPETGGTRTKGGTSGKKAAPQAAERYGSYADCMQAVLVEEPLPADANEMMAIVTAAEQKCSRYPEKKTSVGLSRRK